MSNKKLTVILSVIVVVLLGYIIFFTGNTAEDSYTKQRQEIDSLTMEIVKLQNDQALQDYIISQHKDSIVALDHEIKNKNQKISDIRKYYGDKIKTISTYTPAELDSFFTNRYKQ